MGPIACLESPADCGVSECDREGGRCPLDETLQTRVAGSSEATYLSIKLYCIKAQKTVNIKSNMLPECWYTIPHAITSLKCKLKFTAVRSSVSDLVLVFVNPIINLYLSTYLLSKLR